MTDGAENLITFLQSMVLYTDVATGYVAKPVGHAPRIWQRKSLEDLDMLAFGAPIADLRSFRRSERAARELVEMGYMDRQEWKKLTHDGWRSKPGLKWLTDKLWRVLGILDAVTKERKKRKHAAEAERAAALQAALSGTNSHAMKPRKGDMASTSSAAAASTSLSDLAARAELARPPDTPFADGGALALAEAMAILLAD